MDWTPPTQAGVDSYFERLNNRGQWDTDDHHGRLNLTPAKRQAAMRLARRGRLVSLVRDLPPHLHFDYHMLYPGSRDRCDVAMDSFRLVFHGTAVTHIDALCHVSYDGKVYNNRFFDQYLNSAGASWGSLDPWFEGVKTRGALLDVVAGRPEGSVIMSKPVTPPDLDAAAARAGVRVEPGDVVRERYA